MSFYSQIERIKNINRVLSDRDFFTKIGYNYDLIPLKLREISLPVYSPHQLINRYYENILDIGCGGGTDIYILKNSYMNKKVVGVDISFDLLKEGKSIHKLDVLKANGYFLPFREKSFHLVIMNGTFNQVEDKDRLLSEIERILKPSGEIIICDIFRKSSLLEIEEGIEFNINGALSKEELVNFFINRGFELLDQLFRDDYTKDFGVFSCLLKVP